MQTWHPRSWILGPRSASKSRQQKKSLSRPRAAVVTHISIQRVVKTVGPAVAVEPVKVAIDREELILGARVRVVTHQRVDKVAVLGAPGFVELGDDGCRVDKVTVVEVVVVVVRVAKVHTSVACHVRGRRNHTAPRRFVEERKSLPVLGKPRVRVLELLKPGLSKLLVAQHVIDSDQYRGKFGECLSKQRSALAK